jgi:hypothetical protein
MNAVEIDYRISAGTRRRLLAERWEEEDLYRRRHPRPRAHVAGPVVLAVAGATRETIRTGAGHLYGIEGREPADYRLVVSRGLVVRFASEALALAVAVRFGGIAYLAPAEFYGAGGAGFVDF